MNFLLFATAFLLPSIVNYDGGKQAKASSKQEAKIILI